MKEQYSSTALHYTSPCKTIVHLFSKNKIDLSQFEIQKVVKIIKNTTTSTIKVV
jgi:hypothetical protein